jgi:uncharacterized protein YceH (UPF0502 family)
MNIELTALEARVIGCLIEKQITTPDQYPLSLNALTNACNQKSNRDPVLDLDERAVQQIVDALVRKHLVIERSGFGSRVPKYQHVFCNTEFGSLKFTPIETAILCELLVRGPQTPGELRTRAARMSDVSDVTQIESALNQLMSRQDGPFVARLPREPGRRDSCYAQLFTGEFEGSTEIEATRADPIPAASAPLDDDRLSQLEALVEQLRIEVMSLKQRVDRE